MFCTGAVLVIAFSTFGSKVQFHCKDCLCAQINDDNPAVLNHVQTQDLQKKKICRHKVLQELSNGNSRKIANYPTPL
jgi:hypothetical protein